ncbi:MAG TPA: GTPase HflX [Phycisphaerae bacterium]|nr:GTPase HflX [Phycisphaerae bacterium]HPS52042.1 GTPase HflX [Phycisphaerae bacterium]
MMAELRETFEIESERTLLVCVVLPGDNHDTHDPLGELRALAKTAGSDVVDEILCKRQQPHTGLYVGTGKASQIADRCEMNEIDVVIFDNDLTPGQIRELEAVTKTKVIDRSELILDIFAMHAGTHQAKLQVELAQLEYTYPRLTGMWSHLDRHGGGVGTRGPGERQIETDRRIVQKRVGMLKEKLDAIDRRKLQEVKNRNREFCACLVGYTNAGKSTLMNLLTDAQTYAEDKLFATLETKTRKWELSADCPALLSDTVGFIRNLPHHLVASFRATLEEAIFADLLLHVADASSHRVFEQIDAVHKVLAELGCDPERELLILNKTDRIIDPTVYAVLRQRYPKAVTMSAMSGNGAEKLIAAVRDRATGLPTPVKLRANFRNGRLMSFLARHAKIENQTYLADFAEIDAVIASDRLRELLNAFRNDIAVMD